MIFKCKMCGGALEIESGSSVAVCEYCETKQTLPRLDDEKRANLYDRANHFRRNNEYDKAMGIYEQILAEDITDAEAYWSLVLCCYGIEYVEDLHTQKRVPTVNRVQYTSVYEDENYKRAIQYADETQRKVYEEEARTINEIQKGILEISQKEEPFDIFICYKETDSTGRRTQDSVLATDLYYQLTKEGFKVFFSRITLEDKLGVAYEPYIFAALNSAKVMIVLGTKKEHFNAVWVKNEWCRYLALIKGDASKVLIPAYRDMDPYDLPEEYSHLQAQDMSKLGFMQDLVRGIKKILVEDKPEKEEKNVVSTTSGASVKALVERMYLFLEDMRWNDALEYSERILDAEPKNAHAYFGKLMIELQVRYPERVGEVIGDFGDFDSYQKAIRFASKDFKEQIEGYLFSARENMNKRKYDVALTAMNSAKTKKDYLEAAKLFEAIKDFSDADKLQMRCLDSAKEVEENYWKDNLYKAARLKQCSGVISLLEEAIEMYKEISDWGDSEEQIILCTDKIEKIKEANEVYNAKTYQEILELLKGKMTKRKMEEAISKMRQIEGYRDTTALLEEYTRKVLKKERISKIVLGVLGIIIVMLPLLWFLIL